MSELKSESAIHLDRVKNNYDHDFKELYDEYMKENKSATFPYFNTDEGSILEIMPLKKSSDCRYYGHYGHNWLVVKE